MTDPGSEEAFEDDFLNFPDGEDNFVAPIEQPFGDFFAQDTQNGLGTASGSSNSSAVELSTPITPPLLMTSSLAGSSPVDCMSDMMRSDLYVKKRCL